jgi:hypothetical protein
MAGIILTGDTSGTITVNAPAVAGTNTLTLPAETGSIITSTSLNTESNFVRLAGETLSSNTSTVEFSTSIITTTYKSYILYARMRPVTDVARLLIRFNDNTGTVLASVTDYQEQAYRGTGIDFDDDTMSSITHIGGTGTGTGEFTVQRYEIHEPRATDRKTIITFHCGYIDVNGDSALTMGSGCLDTAEDNQGFRIFFDNGDMASGSSYVLFGVKS